MIVKIKDHDNEGGATQSEALALARKRKVRLISNLEADAMLQDKKKYDEHYAYLPCWTSTRIKYAKGATEALVWNDGKKPRKIHLPLNDGWYLPDPIYGIPNGEPSNSGNPNARYLWRYQDEAYEGLVSRGRSWDWVLDRRVVDCCDRGSRLGVLGESKGKPAKHKHVWVCETCGVKK